MARNHTETVPWPEIEPILYQAITVSGKNQSAIVNTIGYAATNSFAVWASEGKVPVRVKYALLGFIAEYTSITIFSEEDLAYLFSALTAYRVSGQENVRKDLMKRIATKLAE